MLYSSKRPFDFYAGGKGVDLLRAKIFSERYSFKIQMDTKRCKYLPTDMDLCPGDTTKCPHIRAREGCLESGGTVFLVSFPMGG
jgi:hypothetical protein